MSARDSWWSVPKHQPVKHDPRDGAWIASNSLALRLPSKSSCFKHQRNPGLRGGKRGPRGYKRRQRETRVSGSRTRHPIGCHVGRQGEKRVDNTLGKADTPSNTGTHMGEIRGNKGRQDPREGGRTIQHRHTCWETVGDKGIRRETKGNKILGKGDTSNTGTGGEGRQDPWGGENTI